MGLLITNLLQYADLLNSWKHVVVNGLSLERDQHQISPCNINAYVMSDDHPRCIFLTF